MLLYIDDDEIDREMMSRSFRKAGLAFDAANCLEDGVALYNPDVHMLAVIDWNVIPHTGFEVAQALRKINPEIDIIFMSGTYAPDQLHEAAALNPLACLEKSDESTARVIELLRKKGLR